MINKHLLTGLILIAGVIGSDTAFADRGHGGHGGFHGPHVGLGFYFGAPYPYAYYPYPYYYPYDPYYPRVITVPAPVPVQPPVYIEQESAQPSPQVTPAPEATNYWYHCDNPEGYYPYIKDCPGGWQKVVPTPPPR